MTERARGTDRNAGGPAVEPRRLFAAVGVWFGMVVVAIANAAVREALLAPRLGAATTHLLGTATLLFALVIVTVVYFSRAGPHTRPERIAVGLLWAGLTVAFEFAFGHYVAGQSWAELAAQYDPSAGRVWVAVPLFLLVVPSLLGRDRG